MGVWIKNSHEFWLVVVNSQRMFSLSLSTKVEAGKFSSILFFMARLFLIYIYVEGRALRGVLVCVCVYMYICVCMCVSMYMCVCMCICMCMYACVYMCLYMYLYIYVYTCMYVYMSTCMCMYVCVCMCKCISLCVYVCVCMFMCVCFIELPTLRRPRLYPHPSFLSVASEWKIKISWFCKKLSTWMVALLCAYS